jgi:hypothetical protein
MIIISFIQLKKDLLIKEEKEKLGETELLKKPEELARNNIRRIDPIPIAIKD